MFGWDTFSGHLTGGGINLHLAVFNYPAALLKDYWPKVSFDRETVTCLRSVLMKPEHLAWVEEIWTILDRVAV